jgi:hypothetical protein
MRSKRKEFISDTVNILVATFVIAAVLFFAKLAFAWDEDNDNGITVQQIGKSTYIDYGDNHTLACQTVGSVTHCDQTN